MEASVSGFRPVGRGHDTDERNGDILVRLASTVVAAATLAAGGVRASHPVPPLWVADAICETGRNPPNWQFHAGVYEGGIAFYYGTWATWKTHVREARRFSHAYYAPAWVQAKVAAYGLAHFGRWGCLFHSDVWSHR